MNSSLYAISLDIQASYAPAALSMKQFDTGRRLEITLYDGGRPYEMADDCRGCSLPKSPTAQ